MSDNLTWRFLSNDANEIEGPNDPGITTFMDRREENIIREAIQNSLDAQADTARPVKVAFDHCKISAASFGADDLAASLRAAATSTHIANDAAYAGQFKRGAMTLSRNRGGSLACLRIVDSNTHGATDEPRANGAPSKWEALTKGTGSNAKDQQDAAGSFGLGKFAAFAVSDLRTVLYSVAYQHSGQMRRRFQGKTILVSHVRDNGKFRKTGYFGKDDFRPAKDTDVPHPFMLREPGSS